jgi:hypothetical protein
MSPKSSGLCFRILLRQEEKQHFAFYKEHSRCLQNDIQISCCTASIKSIAVANVYSAVTLLSAV